MLHKNLTTTRSVLGVSIAVSKTLKQFASTDKSKFDWPSKSQPPPADDPLLQSWYSSAVEIWVQCAHPRPASRVSSVQRCMRASTSFLEAGWCCLDSCCVLVAETACSHGFQQIRHVVESSLSLLLFTISLCCCCYRHCQKSVVVDILSKLGQTAALSVDSWRKQC